MEEKTLLASAHGHQDFLLKQSNTETAKRANVPVRRNLSGRPAPSPELFSTAAPAPACACWSRGAADDSSPAVPSGPLSAAAQPQRRFNDAGAHKGRTCSQPVTHTHTHTTQLLLITAHYVRRKTCKTSRLSLLSCSINNRDWGFSRIVCGQN